MGTLHESLRTSVGNATEMLVNLCRWDHASTCYNARSKKEPRIASSEKIQVQSKGKRKTVELGRLFNLAKYTPTLGAQPQRSKTWESPKLFPLPSFFFNGVDPSSGHMRQRGLLLFCVVVAPLIQSVWIMVKKTRQSHANIVTTHTEDVDIWAC